MFPIFTGDIRAAQCSGEYRHFHFYFIFSSKLGFGIDTGKGSFIRIGVDALCPQGIAHDIQMGVVNRVILIGPGRHFAEGLGVEQFTPPEGCLEHIAVAFATIQTPAANTGLGRHVTGTIFGLKGLIRIGSV